MASTLRPLLISFAKELFAFQFRQKVYHVYNFRSFDMYADMYSGKFWYDNRSSKSGEILSS